MSINKNIFVGLLFIYKNFLTIFFIDKEHFLNTDYRLFDTINVGMHVCMCVHCTLSGDKRVFIVITAAFSALISLQYFVSFFVPC